MERERSAAAVMLGMAGFVVLAVSEHEGELEQAIETTADLVGCPTCAAVAELHDRRPVWVRDLPSAGRPVMVVWIKRVWRCPHALCPMRTWTESSPWIAARASLTSRARAEICRRVGEDGASVAAVAREFGISWRTAMGAVREHGQPRVRRTGSWWSVSSRSWLMDCRLRPGGSGLWLVRRAGGRGRAGRAGFCSRPHVASRARRRYQLLCLAMVDAVQTGPGPDPDVPFRNLLRPALGPRPRCCPPLSLTHATYGRQHRRRPVLVDPEVSYADRKLGLALLHASRALPPTRQARKPSKCRSRSTLSATARSSSRSNGSCSTASSLRTRLRTFRSPTPNRSSARSDRSASYRR